MNISPFWIVVYDADVIVSASVVLNDKVTKIANELVRNKLKYGVISDLHKTRNTVQYNTYRNNKRNIEDFKR
jgi:hypothetical protein